MSGDMSERDIGPALTDRTLGVILAGGSARRMRERGKLLDPPLDPPLDRPLDKPLLPLGPLRSSSSESNSESSSVIEHIIERLEPQVDRVIINANGDPSRFAHVGLSIIPDSLEGSLGPLAGILAGMEYATDHSYTHIVSVAGDTPFIPRDLVVKLKRCAAPDPDALVIASTRDAPHTLRHHPICALWPVALRHELRADLIGGHRRVTSWVERHSARMCVFERAPHHLSDELGLDPFFNINTPDDLDIARRGVRSH